MHIKKVEEPFAHFSKSERLNTSLITALLYLQSPSYTALINVFTSYFFFSFWQTVIESKEVQARIDQEEINQTLNCHFCDKI